MPAQEQWWRVLPRAIATGGEWIHAPPLKQPAEISFFSSSLLHRRRRRDLQNNQKTQPAGLFSPDLFSDFFPF
jgi:hypothetical protein